MLSKLFYILLISQKLLFASILQINEIDESSKLFDKGVELYNRGRYYSALDIFRKLKNYPPEKSPQLTSSILMCMKSYIQVKRYEDAKNIAREFINKHNNSKYLPFIYYSLGDMYLEQGYYISAIDSYLKSRSIFNNNVEMIKKIDKKIINISSGYVSLQEIDKVISTELNPISKSILSLSLAKVLIYNNKVDEAALVLLKINSSILPNELHPVLDQLKKQTYTNNNNSNKTIGIVLSSLDNESLAFLNGVKAAIVHINEKKNLSINLEVINIEGDIINTINAIDILSRNSNLMAIIGPIANFDDIIFAISSKNLSIPILLPATLEYGISKIGKNIFQMKSNYILQGRYAARYAHRELNAKTIGILSPSDQLGVELTDGFLIEADLLGLDIISIEWYSGIPVDLSLQLSNLRKEALKLYSQNFSSIYLNFVFDPVDSTFDLSSDDFFIDQELVIQEIDSSKILISDIDVMFLPIHKGDISYIAPQFSSIGIQSKIIGNNNWYSPEELNQEMIGSNLNGMIILLDHFIDEKNYTLPSPLIKTIENYQNRNEIEMIIEGFDLTTFLSKHLELSIDRASLLQSIDNTLPVHGISKTFAFSEYSRNNSTINFIEFKNNTFSKTGYFIADSLYILKP